MHPVDAVHGDLGMVVRGDVVLALSASGETEEILRLLATLKRLQVPLISMTGDAVFEKAAGESPATTQAQPAGKRYPPWRRRRMSRSTAPWPRKLAVSGWRRLPPPPPCWRWATRWPWLCRRSAVSRKKTLPTCIPAGKLGKRLARVESLMHTGEAVPRVTPQTRMPDVIYEMSRKKLGVTAVVDGEKLVGVISDGDLRRLLEKRGKDVLDLTRG